MLDYAEALSKLDEFMNAFNEGDMARWARTSPKKWRKDQRHPHVVRPVALLGCAFSGELEAVDLQHGRADRCRFTWQLMRKAGNASPRT
jgi:hypothetical protein